MVCVEKERGLKESWETLTFSWQTEEAAKKIEKERLEREKNN